MKQRTIRDHRELVNHISAGCYDFEMKYTYPSGQSFFASSHDPRKAVFGPYTPETAIPWYTVMFVIACILSVAIIWILKGQTLSRRPGPDNRRWKLVC